MIQLTPTGDEGLAATSTLGVDIGGAESNVACHLVREGVSSAWAGAVGADPFGARLVATVAGRGVDTSLVHVDADAPTGVYLKDPAPDGTDVYYYRSDSAASLLGPSFAERLPLTTTPLVHVTGILPALSPSCDALLDAVLTVRERCGLPVSFDVNWRPALWPDHTEAAKRLAAVAARCAVVLVGLDEAMALWGTRTPDDVRRRIASPTLVVKDDARAASTWIDGSLASVTPAPAPVVDPVGAGDAFAAGFLAAHLRGESPRSATAAGHRRAARVLSTRTDYDLADHDHADHDHCQDQPEEPPCE